MFRYRINNVSRNKDMAEKPFWISYSDMMTALMVLFLITMTVALVAYEKKITSESKQREIEIDELMARIQKSTNEFPGVTVKGRTIDFGDRARYETDSHKLTKIQARLLRAFVPKILEIARDPLGEKWLKRVIVEGYADKRGTYLHNLNLSMQRSERVFCVLLAKPEEDEKPLSKEDRKLVNDIFLVGGYSYNSLKESLEESRRIEFKLEFLDIGEKRPIPPDIPDNEDQYCPLDV